MSVFIKSYDILVIILKTYSHQQDANKNKRKILDEEKPTLP